MMFYGKMARRTWTWDFEISGKINRFLLNQKSKQRVLPAKSHHEYLPFMQYHIPHIPLTIAYLKCKLDIDRR
jgi:hypothetical protein